MKILHFIFCFPPDGAETMLVDIMNEQCKGHSVGIVIINNIYNKNLIGTISKKVAIYCLNRKPHSRNPLKIVVLNLRVFKFRPDVIHFHDDNGILLLKYKGKAKTVLTIHGLHRRLKYLSKYDKLISISEAVRKDLIIRGSLSSSMIYNGIDFSRINIRNKNRKNNSLFNIVAVGRLYHEIKGQEILLKALHILLYYKEMEDITIEIDFIGEGPSLEYLCNLSEMLKIRSHVNFLGLKSRDFIYAHLCTYSLLVQPSVHEGFGLTVVEGMASKIPVLVSNIPALLELIHFGNYGYQFISGSPENCADIIECLIKKKDDPSTYKKLDETYTYASRQFSVNKTVLEYLNLYQSDQI